MKIDFVGNKISLKLKRKIKKAVVLTLSHLGQKSQTLNLSINIIDEAQMQELNARTRDIDRVTDVLSYPNFQLEPFELLNTDDKSLYCGKYIYLGDMAICLEKAQEQAEEYGWSLEEEVIKLVVHSTLHLMGFDHIEDKDYEIMNKQEQEIANKINKQGRKNV